VRVIAAAVLQEDQVNTFVAAAIERLRLDLDPKEAGPLVRALMDLRQSAQAAASGVALLAAEGHLLDILEQQSQATRFVDKAAALLGHMVTRPSGDADAFPGQASQGRDTYLRLTSTPPEEEKELSSLTHRARRSLGSKELVVLTKDAVAGPLASRLVQELGSTPESSAWFTPLTVVEEWTTLDDLLNDSASLIAQGDRRSQVQGVLVDRGFTEADVPLYRALIEGAERYSDALAELVIDGLSALTADGWADELSADESDILDLAAGLGRTEAPFELGTPFADAVLGHLTTIAAGDVETWDADTWDGLLLALGSPERETLLRNLRDEALFPGGPGLPSLIRALGPQFSDGLLLSEKSDEVLRRLGKNLLESADDDAVSWFVSVIRSAPNILSSAPRGSIKDLVGRCEAALAGSEVLPESLAAKIQELRDLLEQQR